MYPMDNRNIIYRLDSISQYYWEDKVIYFTSDHHFGHKNIIKYCNRPFSSVEEMDSIMIERWNQVVKPNDMVYHLGDFTLNNRDKAIEYFSKLNGKVYIVKNPSHHDKNWIKFNSFSYTTITTTNVMSSVMYIDPITTIRYGIKTIVMCHFPMLEWEGSHHGSIHFHGHSHGNIPNRENFIDVGVDCWNYYPITFEQIMEEQMK